MLINSLHFLREKAKQELEDWYKRHEDSISKTKAANR
jgi:hypothetical protein